MVKDVNNSKDGSPTNSNVFYSIGYNSPFAVLNNVAYFAANDGINGNEVWRSDGTSAGTYMLKNIDGTAKSSSPSKFVTSGKYVYFIGSDSIHGAELWRTNGMPAGTVLVKDLMPGTGNSGLGYFTDINGTLFFSATTPSAGNELMKSNGTGAGTVVVKDVVPGNGYSSVNAICNVNGKAVYYYATGIDSLSGLYASDGTAAGTIRLTGGDIVMGSNTSAAVGNKFFFMGVDHEPWVSDGTPQGTHLIKAINPAAGSYPLNFTDVNGIAYFTATDQTHGTELWRSDGMDAGTYLVKDITPGKDSSDLSLFTAAGNTVFFLVTNTAGNTDLWKSDGTSGGTLMIKSFGTGNLPPVQNLAVINGILYFDAYTAGKGYEMWRSDGSTTGTVLVKDIYSGIYSSYASGFTGLNNKILFSATDGINGNELWTSDGTVGNASLLKDINQSSTSDGALYWGITPFKNKIYFIAYTPQNGNELWVTNGAEGNTTRVTDIQPGSLSGLKTTISQFHTSSGRLYFEAANLKYGNELWSTDGDSSKIVKDITPGREGTTLPEQYFPGNKKTFGNIDSTVLFVTGAGGTQLWKTKANSAVLLTQGTGISGLTTNKNIVYFSMYHNELWKTDGT
ncbi:MAG TPA: ELWxxDGT repeat protein, partial [Parafilimonas sp.]|nr:ELWxxDGT repeat protein [Parafilimonas sp.]